MDSDNHQICIILGSKAAEDLCGLARDYGYFVIYPNRTESSYNLFKLFLSFYLIMSLKCFQLLCGSDSCRFSTVGYRNGLNCSYKQHLCGITSFDYSLYVQKHVLS
jgi:hypothetical protein